MKKCFAVFLSLMLACFLIACGKTASDESASQRNSLASGNSAISVNGNSAENSPNGSKVLIAYFSLSGNADYPEGVEATTSASIVTDEIGRYGTTEYIANMIQHMIGGDIHLIQTAEPYATDFDEVISRNHKEMAADSLPLLKSNDLNMDQYEIIFIGYPTWATNVPQAILSFLSEYDLSGKTVIPFCTHDGYGAGNSFAAIKDACPGAKLSDGIAIEAPNVPDSEKAVQNWLDEIGIMQSFDPVIDQIGETAITVTIGEQKLTGVLYDNAESQQFIAMLPQTISMGEYGGREYYGRLDSEIKTQQEGQLTFENGHITYCPSNNTVAIFYAQTNRPNLTMKVIPLGIVTSDLAVFATPDKRMKVTFALAD